MRTPAGDVLFHLSLAVSGAALLAALGLVRIAPRDLAFALGPGFLCGVALVFPLEIGLGVAGVPLGLPTFAAVVLVSTAALAAVSVVRARRGRAVPEREPRDRFDVWTLRVGGIVLALFLIAAARTFLNLPTFEDDAIIWSPKALGLFYYDSFDIEVFRNVAYAPSHLDYPVLRPLQEATFYRARGHADLRLDHLELWIVFASFVWTAAFLLRGRQRPIWWLAPIAAIAVAPGVYNWIQIGYTDISVSCFVGAGVLSLGLWIETRRTGYLLLGAIMLGAGANTKEEGLAALAAVALAMAAVLLATRRLRPILPLVGAAAIVVVSVLPWRLWVMTHDPEGAVSRAAAAGMRHPRAHEPPTPDNSVLDRLATAVDGVITQLGDQGKWLWTVPAGIVLAVVVLLGRRARDSAAFYLATGFVMTAILIGTYWIGTGYLPFELGGGVARTVTDIVFVATVAAAHLLSTRAFADERDDAERT